MHSGYVDVSIVQCLDDFSMNNLEVALRGGSRGVEGIWDEAESQLPSPDTGQDPPNPLSYMETSTIVLRGVRSVCVRVCVHMRVCACGFVHRGVGCSE